MKPLLKYLIIIVAALAVLGAVAMWPQSGESASESWTYSNPAVSNGTSESPVFYLQVRGKGEQPTLAYLVRFPDVDAAPTSTLGIPHALSNELQAEVQKDERWKNKLMLIAGRSDDEKIEIEIDGKIARKLLGKPGDQYKDIAKCEEFWEEYVQPHLPDDS